jgi:hypothetical protein
MRYLLTLLMIYPALTFSQPISKHCSYYTVSMGYRYVKTGNLNEMLQRNNLPEITPHMFTLGFGYTKRINNHIFGCNFNFSSDGGNTFANENTRTTLSSREIALIYGYQLFKSERWSISPFIGISSIQTYLSIDIDFGDPQTNDFESSLNHFTELSSQYLYQCATFQSGIQGFYSVGSGFTLGFQTGYHFLTTKNTWEIGNIELENGPKGLKSGGLYVRFILGFRYSRIREQPLN